MASPMLTLNDGRPMPQLGFGVWQIPQVATRRHRLGARGRVPPDRQRHRLRQRGRRRRGAAAGVVPRDDVFVTTKLANPDQGFDQALRAFDASLDLLGLDAVDLYLIHWPCPAATLCRDVAGARAAQGRGPGALDRRLELHGRASATAVRRGRRRAGGQPDRAASALPAERRCGPSMHARHRHPVLEPARPRPADREPVIAAIAAKHGCTWAQVVLRWHLDLGVSVVTRSVSPDASARISRAWTATRRRRHARGWRHSTAGRPRRPAPGPHGRLTHADLSLPDKADSRDVAPQHATPDHRQTAPLAAAQLSELMSSTRTAAVAASSSKSASCSRRRTGRRTANG